MLQRCSSEMDEFMKFLCFSLFLWHTPKLGTMSKAKSKPALRFQRGKLQDKFHIYLQMHQLQYIFPTPMLGRLTCWQIKSVFCFTVPNQKQLFPANVSTHRNKNHLWLLGLHHLSQTQYYNTYSTTWKDFRSSFIFIYLIQTCTITLFWGKTISVSITKCQLVNMNMARCKNTLHVKNCFFFTIRAHALKK